MERLKRKLAAMPQPQRPVRSIEHEAAAKALQENKLEVPEPAVMPESGDETGFMSDWSHYDAFAGGGDVGGE